MPIVFLLQFLSHIIPGFWEIIEGRHPANNLHHSRASVEKPGSLRLLTCKILHFGLETRFLSIWSTLNSKNITFWSCWRCLADGVDGLSVSAGNTET